MTQPRRDVGKGGRPPDAARRDPLSAESLLGAIDVGVIVMDQMGRCVHANACATRMLGYGPGEIVGADVHHLIHHSRPDGSPYPREECPVLRTVRTGASARVTNEAFWSREGEPLPVEYASRPVFEEGRLTGAVVTFRAGVRGRPEPRTEDILDNITDAFYVLDHEWRFTYLNSEAERVLRRPRDELLGKNVWSVFPEAVGSPFYKQFRKAADQRVTVEVEGYSRALDAWFEARAYPSESGLSVYFLHVDERGTGGLVRERWLEESGRRVAELDTVLRSIPDAVYVGDQDGIRACNGAALSMLGFEDLAELNQNIATLAEKLQNRFARTGERIPPDQEPFARALRGETVVEEVVARHLKAGRDVVVRCAAAPIRYGGTILGAVAVNTDITERKLVEENLRASGIFVRSTLDSLSAHIAILDETGRILATNKAWRDFGSANPPVPANAATGGNYLDVCDATTGEGAEEAAAFARGIRDVLAGRADTYEQEYPCHAPDRRRWFLGRVTPFVDTHPPKAVVAHEEVTERRLAMEEVELRARQQEAVADLGRRALAKPDLPEIMDEAVELVARVLGVEYAEVVERAPEGLLLRTGRGWREGLVGNVIEEAGTGSQSGYTLLTDDPVVSGDITGETRFDPAALHREHGVVSGVSTVIRGRDEAFGVLGAYTGHRRDFTENDVNFLRAVANVLSEAIEWRKAEEGMAEIRTAERSRMARDLHDGPLQDLTYALASAQLVHSTSEDPKLERWLEGTVEALKRTGRELRAAVYDLRLEEQRGRPFSELVESLVDLNRRMTPERSVKLEKTGGFPESPLGENDTELLRIVQEALTNGRRHSGAGTVVVSLHSDTEGFRVRVTDDGRGFGPGTAPGVGLKSMRERAHALGGRLTVESEPGKGTTVSFARRAGGARDEPRPERDARVLLVEDHAAVREAVAAAFERETGFRVSGQAGSLAEARDLVSGGLLMVDVAVVDLGLPDGYGGDLIRTLRRTNPEAQVLVLSATLDRNEIARAVEAGAAGVIHKSAGMDELMEAVRRLLAGETLMPLHEVVDLLRLAASRRDEDLDARRAIARLTPREHEVLRALAEGLDGKEIARRLGISDKTERNHMANIMTKLGVHSRLQALVFALRHGVTDVER